MATGVVVVMRNNIEQSQASMRSQAELLNNQLQTNIQITETNYTADNVRIYVVNNGKTTLKLTKIDVYVDDQFIPRNDTNRTITIEASTDVKNPGLWDPDEIIRIDVNKTLVAGEHRVSVLTNHGNRDEELFSI